MPNPDAEAKGRSQGALLIALGVVGILTAIFFFMTYAIDRAKTMHFQYEGRETSAQIEGLDWKSRPFRSLYVTYTYGDETGGKYRYTELYPFSDGSQFKPGQSIDVLYLGNNPAQSRILSKQGLMMDKLKDVPWETISLIALGGLIAITIGLMKRR